MIFAVHICGKCVDVLDDYVEIGVKVWNAAQIMHERGNAGITGDIRLDKVKEIWPEISRIY